MSGMATQQSQAYCNRCAKPTLHTRVTRDVNHVLHLLLTLFCCGLWLPIWILDALITSMSDSSEPFLCSLCGQRAGTITAEQRAQQQLLDRKAASARAERRAATRVTISRSVKFGFEDATAWLSDTTSVAWASLCELPAQTNRVLKFVAGKGNDIVFRFLQVLTVLVLIGAFAGIAFALLNALMATL